QGKNISTVCGREQDHDHLEWVRQRLRWRGSSGMVPLTGGLQDDIGVVAVPRKEVPMSVKFGLFVPQGWKMDLVDIDDPVEQYEAMTAVAKRADQGPWDSVWVYDHFHTVPEPTMETTFEAWTVSATLARDTERVRIGGRK